MKRIILVVIMLMFSLQSCGSITDIFGIAKEVGITWNPKSDSKPIDSVRINFNPVYRVEKIDTLNFETDTIIDGYSIWILQQCGIRRTEVTKLDTVIYIYKK